MKNGIVKWMAICLMSFSVFSCRDEGHAMSKVPEPEKDMPAEKGPGQIKRAVFAGGCFWASEEAFDQLAAVKDSVSGYAGGTAATASYREYESTGHAEVVQVTYDSSEISYGQLLKVLFSFIDPTQVDGQGPDRGHGYRSAIFYSTPQEKAVAEAYIKQLTDAKVFDGPIATTVEPLEKFYPAESEHQDYLKSPQHREEGYVQSVSLKKVEKVREAFAGQLKMDAAK